MKTVTLHLNNNTAERVSNDARTILVPIKGLEFMPELIEVFEGNWWVSYYGDLSGHEVKPPCKIGDVVRLKGGKQKFECTSVKAVNQDDQWLWEIGSKNTNNA